MSEVTVSFACSKVNVLSANAYDVKVTITVEPSEVIEQFDTDDIVSAVGIKKLLDEIGMDECMEYFSLVEGD